MRSSMMLVSLLVATSTAVVHATPAPKTPAINLAPIDLTTVPAQCRPIAKEAGAARLEAALAARIALANCLADVALAPLVLCDCEDSILAIDEAVRPSVALLDDVIAASRDDVTKVIAERAKAELYTSMVTRMVATLPPAGTTPAAIALHDARKAILDGLLARWRAAAARSDEHVLAIVKASPRLARNPVVAAAVRMAKDRLRHRVAVAPAPAPGAGSKTEHDRDAIITELEPEESLR